MSYFDDPANDVTTYEAEMQDRYAPLATMGDAHREWHLNSGVPMGTPGCPQDACHAPEPDRCGECGAYDPEDCQHEDVDMSSIDHLWEYDNPVDLGMYDDDPNPYHGDDSDWGGFDF